MEVITGFFRFLLIFFTVKTVLNMLFKIRPANREKIEESKIENDKETEIQEEKVEDMVFDEICQAYVVKSKAYQVVMDDGDTHYFCSWDCRQKHIDSK
ncbi:hypothetical protein [Alkaliphilus peptidifermentans]|uniref:MYM-type Zinc finger with FCS sequence motif-containing protein n=1 Tax=Alkaliphilus peptidifermentans DSM 18978 TaxID=1120976 RepID=A0A1G5EZL2_9FIRM|nr:hypothetical protein [Alkaliphilus peptidifermentans]SCY32403.1 MYM-type Zinc finger with FCS sequence motif-containing protein [Alkaliphilus peptidifermentans DSM 18978]